MLMQLRQATLTVLELLLKKSMILVMREVLPQPVLPCRHSGVVVPFYDIAMKSKMRRAYYLRPGTSRTTSSNLFLSSDDWNPSLSSRFSFGGGGGGGGCFFSSRLLILRQISYQVYIFQDLMIASSASGDRQPLQQRSMQRSVSCYKLKSLSYPHLYIIWLVLGRYIYITVQARKADKRSKYTQ